MAHRPGSLTASRRKLIALLGGAAGAAAISRIATGCQRQYRHGVGREIPAGRLHAGHGRDQQRGQRNALRQASFHFPPRHCADRLNARIAALGNVPLSLSPADFGRLIADDTEKWGRVVKFAGIKPE
jgi:hypothetical protein